MTWQPSALSTAQLQERRRGALKRLPQGQRGALSLAALAREMGVSRQSAWRWYRAWSHDGARGLRSRRHPGRPAKLSPAQWRELKGLIAQGAKAAGFASEAWTLKRLARLIEQHFSVHYRYLGESQRAQGLFLQRPIPRARERDEALIRAWLRHDWLELKKRLAASGAVLSSWTRRITRFGPL